MNTNALKTAVLLLLAVAISTTACRKDEDTDPVQPAPVKERIVGTWNVTSFLLANQEYMGTLVERSAFEFKAYTGTQGDFTQTVKYKDEATEERIAGKYRFTANQDSIRMEAAGEVNTMAVKINGTQLELKGRDANQPLTVKATRRN